VTVSFISPRILSLPCRHFNPGPMIPTLPSIEGRRNTSMHRMYITAQSDRYRGTRRWAHARVII
jgi:hypothetical protein